MVMNAIKKKAAGTFIPPPAVEPSFWEDPMSIKNREYHRIFS